MLLHSCHHTQVWHVFSNSRWDHCKCLQSVVKRQHSAFWKSDELWSWFLDYFTCYLSTAASGLHPLDSFSQMHAQRSADVWQPACPVRNKTFCVYRIFRAEGAFWQTPIALPDPTRKAREPERFHKPAGPLTARHGSANSEVIEMYCVSYLTQVYFKVYL